MWPAQPPPGETEKDEAVSANPGDGEPNAVSKHRGCFRSRKKDRRTKSEDRSELWE